MASKFLFASKNLRLELFTINHSLFAKSVAFHKFPL